MINLWLIFVTGLLSGGITCVAVQGGLLATAVASRVGRPGEEKSAKVGVRDVGVFLVAKLAAHILFGFLLGLAGSALKLSPFTTAVMQGILGVYMVGVGMAMLDVHPFFRRFLLQTPRFLGRFIRKTSKSGDVFAPAILGASTIFIPCGTTQAMMALAITSGSPWWGAAILGTFVLGTSPVFFALGAMVATLGDLVRSRFMKVAAVVVIGMALVSINSALVLAGSPVSAQNVWHALECEVSYCGKQNLSTEPTNEVNITFTRNGYKVDNPVIKAGSKVKLNLINKDGYSCIQAFTIAKLGVSEVVSPGDATSVEIVAPDKPGLLSFSCSMGMYPGELKVVQ